MDKSLRPEPPAFPATVSGWQRFVKTNRTINDYVEEIHLLLLSDPEKKDYYQSFLWAVFDSQAVEGSLSADNTISAQLIRERAKEQDENHPLASEKLATIALALGVVLRRYHQSRTERRDMIGGKVVPNPKNEKE